MKMSLTWIALIREDHALNCINTIVLHNLWGRAFRAAMLQNRGGLYALQRDCYKQFLQVVNYIVAINIPTQRVHVPPVKHVWRAPGNGWLKLNTDGATDGVNGCTDIGVVVRNHECQFHFGQCRRYYAMYESSILELTSCRDALVCAVENGYFFQNGDRRFALSIN